MAVVLVVEDSSPLRSVLALMLATDGHVTLEAADGAAAVEQAHGGPVDALLVDLTLPGGMNGLQLAAAVRRIHPHVGVVYMSGYPNDRQLADGEFLRKPFNGDELRRAIGKITRSRETEPPDP